MGQKTVVQKIEWDVDDNLENSETVWHIIIALRS